MTNPIKSLAAELRLKGRTLPGLGDYTNGQRDAYTDAADRLDALAREGDRTRDQLREAVAHVAILRGRLRDELTTAARYRGLPDTAARIHADVTLDEINAAAIRIALDNPPPTGDA
jgi:hypothetical protein